MTKYIFGISFVYNTEVNQLQINSFRLFVSLVIYCLATEHFQCLVRLFLELTIFSFLFEMAEFFCVRTGESSEMIDKKEPKISSSVGFV